MDETKTGLLTNKVDEEKIKQLCNKLNLVVSGILYMNPNFIYYGSREYGYYTVINNNRYHKKIGFHLDFRLYYPDKKSDYYDLEVNNLDKSKFNKEIENRYNKHKILYAYIQWMSLDPKGTGRGSKIVKELLSLLKEMEDLEFILLHPIDKDANNFWAKNGFVDEGIDTKLDKRIKSDASKRLIYKFT